MAYNLDKYRSKREKVLGIRRRRLSAGVLSVTAAVLILCTVGAGAVRQSVAYFQTRHLDDAIYKLVNPIDGSVQAAEAVGRTPGVRGVVIDTHGSRLVITFDRTALDLPRIETLLEQHGLEFVLLNRVDHRQRRATLEKEAESEAP